MVNNVVVVSVVFIGVVVFAGLTLNLVGQQK